MLMPIEPISLISPDLSLLVSQVVAEIDPTTGIPLWFYISSIGAVAATFTVPLRILWVQYLKILSQREEEMKATIGAHYATADALKEIADATRKGYISDTKID